MSIFADYNTCLSSLGIRALKVSFLFVVALIREPIQVKLSGLFDGNNAFLGSLVILTLKSIIFVVALLLETGQDESFAIFAQNNACLDLLNVTTVNG